MKKEKENFIRSGSFKRVLGIYEKSNIVITKDMIGKEKLEELKKEILDNLNT